ncbi:MAG TPA: glycosyltransferase family 1 protein [Actinomycetota bacterium]|nr:glycosyltransferase family 1 protein [Actinomycetota bacterium]
MTSVAFHIDQLWFAAPGGIGTYVRELVPAIERVDDPRALTLFRTRWSAGGPPAEWLDGRRVVELPGTMRSLYPRWDLLARPPLPLPLAACEVVHATNPAAIPPAGPAQGLVVTVHDLAFEHFPELFPRRWRWLYRAGLKAAVNRADAILTPSQATADDLLSRTSADPAKVHVTALAASLPQTEADPVPLLQRMGIERPYVLFVGTLEPRKNLVLLVRAYRDAAATGLPHSLVLAGAVGWQSDTLEAEIAKTGPGTIVRPGLLAGDELDAVYRSAAAFVYPSLYEGFGLPVVEAMARGVPTIASDASSIPEVAGSAAYLVDPRSQKDLAVAIERVLTDEARAADMRRDGPMQAATFSWDETARNTIAVYRKIAS